MKQATRNLGRWLRQMCRSINPRSDLLKADKPPRASDIILGITLVMLAFVLIAALVSQAFSSA